MFFRCLLWAKPGAACLFQPGWVWECFSPSLPLHLTQKMFENPRFLPSPASPTLGNRRLKEEQTKVSLCSGQLMGHEAATPPLLLLPSQESSLPIFCSSSRHVKGLLGVAVTSKPGLRAVFINYPSCRTHLSPLLCPWSVHSLLGFIGCRGDKDREKGTAGISLPCSSALVCSLLPQNHLASLLESEFPFSQCLCGIRHSRTLLHMQEASFNLKQCHCTGVSPRNRGWQVVHFQNPLQKQGPDLTSSWSTAFLGGRRDGTGTDLFSDQ